MEKNPMCDEHKEPEDDLSPGEVLADIVEQMHEPPSHNDEEDWIGDDSQL